MEYVTLCKEKSGDAECSSTNVYRSECGTHRRFIGRRLIFSRTDNSGRSVRLAAVRSSGAVLLTTFCHNHVGGRFRYCGSLCIN